jgi:hypothetical protein
MDGTSMNGGLGEPILPIIDSSIPFFQHSPPRAARSNLARTITYRIVGVRSNGESTISNRSGEFDFVSTPGG